MDIKRSAVEKVCLVNITYESICAEELIEDEHGVCEEGEGKDEDEDLYFLIFSIVIAYKGHEGGAVGNASGE